MAEAMAFLVKEAELQRMWLALHRLQLEMNQVGIDQGWLLEEWCEAKTKLQAIETVLEMMKAAPYKGLAAS